MKNTKKSRDTDKQIEQAWYRLACGIQVDVMDIGAVFNSCRLGIASGRNLEELIHECIAKYRKN